MSSAIIYYIFVLLLKYCLAADDGGFGPHYDWVTLDEGLEIAKNENKPIMVVIHKSWCGACKALKPQFYDSEDIKKLSKNFVMVIAGDDNEPKGEKFAIDGSYVPRIYFLNSLGEVQEDIFNESGNSKYKYFYFNTETIISSMKRAKNIKTPQTKSPQDEL